MVLDDNILITDLFLHEDEYVIGKTEASRQDDSN